MQKAITELRLAVERTLEQGISKKEIYAIVDDTIDNMMALQYQEILLRKISNTLCEFGISGTRFYYFTEVFKFTSTKKYFRKLEVYSYVAILYESTPEKVEGMLNRAINDSWKSGMYEDVFKKYFGNDCEKKPTTGEFISVITEYIKLSSKKGSYL